MATEVGYGYSKYKKPSALLNYMFMSTVNVAARTLVAVASSSSTGKTEVAAAGDYKWRASDHLRFMVMLMTWTALWVLRVLMDHFPYSSSPLTYHPPGSSILELSSSSLPTTSSTGFDLDMDMDMGMVVYDSQVPDGESVNALGRALTHILALLNEIPASSRKYQFAVTMADKIVDANARDGHMELLHINRIALSSAFARTLALLHRSLESSGSRGVDQEEQGGWTWRVIGSLPLGSFLASSLKGIGFCLGAIFPQKQSQVATYRVSGEDGDDAAVVAEKYAQECLWIANKMRGSGAMEEALVQWSLASGLASLSLVANPRVQGLVLKISAILFGEMRILTTEAAAATVNSREVKLRLMVLWLPLFCYAGNGMGYPVLTGYEKAEMERIMDELISSLPASDQQLILTNWLQDFAVSTSDWPNLQISYDRWCHSTRNLITSTSTSTSTSTATY